MKLQHVLDAGLLGYLLGSFPSGAIVARTYADLDLTATGSGRTGATNVLRTLGPRAAAIVFAGDFIKGALAVVLARRLSGGNTWVELVGAIMVVLGHSYSPFLGFRGGRGVVTGLASTAVVAPKQMLLSAAIAGLVMARTRYVSLGSITGACVGAILMVKGALDRRNPAWVAWAAILAPFIILAHRDNIERLRAGTERRLGAG